MRTNTWHSCAAKCATDVVPQSSVITHGNMESICFNDKKREKEI